MPSNTRKLSMKKKLISVFLVLLIILIGYQFRDIVNNPPITSDFSDAPIEVKKTFRKSCYDCHSNETKISFYNKFPLIAELVKRDIETGRSKLNFSEWDKYSQKEKRTILYNILTKIKKKVMPPKNYLFMHPKAEITKKEVDNIELYIKTLEKEQTFKKSTVDHLEFEHQQNQWLENQTKDKVIQNAPNGIEFPYDYRNWQVISNSFRKDHNSLRVILGNDIAIKAIKDNMINPWPDGAILGKVVWNQRSDENWEAAIVPSTFIHVEFMFKDSKKYDTTKGWGWARWIGNDLQPFGQSFNFSQSCIECHIPVKDKDYVFSTPSIFP
jgi:hypothetical protein